MKPVSGFGSWKIMRSCSACNQIDFPGLHFRLPVYSDLPTHIAPGAVQPLHAVMVEMSSHASHTVAILWILKG